MTHVNADTLQHQIESRLAEREPQVEVLLVEVAGATARVFIDHPDGVSLELCERVTRALPEVREQLALEVSSPGSSVRSPSPTTSAASSAGAPACARAPPRDGQRSFTGQLVGASERDVTIAADAGVIAIPYDDIHRSNLVEE